MTDTKPQVPLYNRCEMIYLRDRFRSKDVWGIQCQDGIKLSIGDGCSVTLRDDGTWYKEYEPDKQKE